MSIDGFKPRFQIRQVGTGYLAGAKVTAEVEDSKIRQQPGQQGYDGLEKVFVELKRRDNGQIERVEVPFQKTIDPSPGFAIEDRPYDPTQGPHGNRGGALVTVASGRKVDQYELYIDAEKYELSFGQEVKFHLVTNQPGGHFEVAARPDNLWK